MKDDRGPACKRAGRERIESGVCGFAETCPFVGCDAERPGAPGTKAGQFRRYAKGEVIALQGHRQSGLIAVLRGTVKLSKSLEDGRTQIVGLRFAGEVVAARPCDSTWLVTIEAA